MNNKTTEQLEEEINSQLSLLEDHSQAIEPIAPFVTSSAYADSFWLSCIVLAFGLFISVLMAYLVKSGKDPETLLRSFGTILIIIVAVFLIVAGYSEKQIAPVIGLLGTVAGYILGKSSTHNK